MAQIISECTNICFRCYHMWCLLLLDLELEEALWKKCSRSKSQHRNVVIAMGIVYSTLTQSHFFFSWVSNNIAYLVIHIYPFVQREGFTSFIPIVLLSPSVDKTAEIVLSCFPWWVTSNTVDFLMWRPTPISLSLSLSLSLSPRSLILVKQSC